MADRNRILTIDINVYDGWEVHSTGFSVTVDRYLENPELVFEPAIGVITEHLREYEKHEG